MKGSPMATMQTSLGTVSYTDEGSGPPMLASAAARWGRANWKFTPTTNGTYTLPVAFVLH